jgi:hypothetical protein
MRSIGSGVASINAVGLSQMPIKVGSSPVQGRANLSLWIVARPLG